MAKAPPTRMTCERSSSASIGVRRSFIRDLWSVAYAASDICRVGNDGIDGSLRPLLTRLMVILTIAPIARYQLTFQFLPRIHPTSVRCGAPEHLHRFGPPPGWSDRCAVSSSI